MFHDGEGMLAARLVGGNAVDEAGALTFRRIAQDVAVHRDIGLVAVLLEEHPAQNLRRRPRIIGKQSGAAREEVEDGARFRQHTAVLETERRHLADRIDRAEFARGRFAADLRDVDAVMREAELGEQQADLVDVAGVEIAVKCQHGVALQCCRSYLAQRRTSGSSRRAISMKPLRLSAGSGRTGWRTASEAMIPPSFMSTLQPARPHCRFS